jgi:hypothetical protein
MLIEDRTPLAIISDFVPDNIIPMASSLCFALCGTVSSASPSSLNRYRWGCRMAHVRFWHKADILNALTNVRYRG